MSIENGTGGGGKKPRWAMESVAKHPNKFKPFKLIKLDPSIHSTSRTTVTTTLKGSVSEEFDKMCEETGLNKSQLLTQMVFHCLGKSAELKDFYRRLAVLGE